MKRKPIKVGFDLDGVLLYNPARIVRPLISLLKKKKILIDRKELEFYVPKPGPQQLMWDLFHKSSCFMAPGIDRIRLMKKEGIIEPYLITGRFGHLENDFNKWKRKMRADELFERCYMNSADEQPHLFKERLITELNLEIFVEDNWDIVKYLSSNKKRKIIWVSNIFDWKITHPYKVSNLNQAIDRIEQIEQH